MVEFISKSPSELTQQLWETAPEIRKVLTRAATLEEVRDDLFRYLGDLERHYFNIYSAKDLKALHICERNNAKECIRVVKNTIRTENEILTRFSALDHLRMLARWKPGETLESEPGFIAEYLFLFRGMYGQSGIADEVLTIPENPAIASQIRARKLNAYARQIENRIAMIPSGTHTVLVQDHAAMKNRILEYFGATEVQWSDPGWQMKHIISDSETLRALTPLNEEENAGLTAAENNGIPFQITPYYLSLFHTGGLCAADRAVRAQVLPSAFYSEQVNASRLASVDMDFMGEKSTSPIPCITRRYPQIVILKPIDTCPQICVYCQRNWEIKSIREAHTSRSTVKTAIRWIRDNHQISEVLITGGDPLMLTDSYIAELLDELSQIAHVERIRIGSRVPVTLPFRITDELASILARHHEPGRREICLVTHFEHPTEITPEAIEAVRKIRRMGLSVYNQQVFTYFNSQRYETAALRKALKLAGIDPYYSFNTKGKEETTDFRVPIARLEQERKEEARFLPGLVRTDEPVFNVPRLGKSHLRAWQDHEIIMISRTGERIYRFYPWESRVTFVDDYIYTDTPIYDYLMRLHRDGLHPEQYSSIWFYF